MHGSGVRFASGSVNSISAQECGLVSSDKLQRGGGVLHVDSGRKHQRQHSLPRYVAKAFLVASAIVVAAMLVIAHQGKGWTASGAVLPPHGNDRATTTATASVPRGNSRGRFRSEGLHGQNDREHLDAPSIPASSRAPSSVSRALGDVAITTTAPASGGDGDGGGGAASTQEKRARIGYLIMSSGTEELHKTKRLLKAIYDPNNFYLVHLDRKDKHSIRRDFENFIEEWDNVRMLEPALDVSWGGYTITLTAIFGICTMVQWNDEWDFFINLSASDFPLLPQSELTTVLGKYADVGMNFVSGEPLNERNRAEVLIDDQGLYREKQSSKAGRPLKVGKARLPPSKSMFTVYKGEFWVILHRSFCKYLEASPDNVARSLQAYFSKFRISDESYFQTVLCHPLAPSFLVQPAEKVPIVCLATKRLSCSFTDNLRFVSWPDVIEGHYVLHPDPITGGASGNVNVAMDSGALFARKFDTKVSQEAYTVLEKSLSEPNPGRLARAANRLNPAAAVTGRKKFCFIPDGYSIQEVLSRPPKKAMGMHQDRSDGSSSNRNRGGSSSPPAVGKDQLQRQPSFQTREAREGEGGSEP
ncbi:GT14 [Ectocarpus sp. CCAP 1310/34]|nr:GT14 [Ectocarpus sp. CCAP 1310/34]